ncbi:RND transporter [Lactococcus hodotermopsidis]|uniref:RND transporter n=1 Tax=Pseudolactococcus hodotermopsidis TaxID=2709157 RepID=A0A6A0B879_9LACT|nr:efflux RND transporter periplasmic adaptor subunit [Lactococcus hodotermopsidis]GFH41570.1 RND transporter [Lactococcus hodotermopsidis]
MMKKFYKKHPLIVLLSSIGAAIVVGIIALSLFLLPSKGTAKKSTTPDLYTVKKQADSIFRGNVSAKSSTDYFEDPTLGEVSQVNVTDGQEVKTGDVLLTYTKQLNDLSAQEFAVKNAENSLANAQADMAEAERKGATLSAKFDKAKEELERQEINAQIEANNEAWKAAQRAVASANLACEEARTSFESQKNNQTTTVKSKTDGIVIMGTKSETSPKLSVVSRETLVNGKVTEYDYDKLQNDAVVSVETVDLSKKVTGKITYISPVPEKSATESSSSNYSFRVALDEPLQNGYTVQIHLPDSAIYIPKSAVKNGQVYVKNGKNFDKVAVETQKAGGRLQVLSGLKVGDKIVKEAADYADKP